MIFYFETDRLGVLLPVIHRAVDSPLKKERAACFRDIANTMRVLKLIPHDKETKVVALALGIRADGQKQLIVTTETATTAVGQTGPEV